MQALLSAVGVGAGVVPMAAALSWVLKDGLGQLGGVVSAALISTRFDAEPKRWRLLSAVALDAATALEVACLAAPALFLPLATAANVGKNVAWLSASASRAGIHQALATHGNLADVTAKAGSQSIAASTAGTLLGALASPLLGGAPETVAAAFAVCSAVHLSCVAASLRGVALPTLNAARMRAAVAPAIASALDDGDARGAVAGRVRRPVDVAREENLLWVSDGGSERRRSAESAREGHGSAVDVRVFAETPLHALARRGLLTSAVADALQARRYALVVTRGALGAGGPDDGSSASRSSSSSSSSRGVWRCAKRNQSINHNNGAPNASHPHPVSGDALLGMGGDASRFAGEAAPVADASMPPHGVRAEDPAIVVHVLVHADATWRDLLLAHVHALLLEGALRRHGGDARRACAAADAALATCGATVLAELEAAGWWVGVPLLERQQLDMRVSVRPAEERA